ncbi:MAG TPA: SRPBCC family protein [Woeseiaceae bacterium]|nr:SRPBCC family protein [Woeseiaceae bacterium]
MRMTPGLCLRPVAAAIILMSGVVLSADLREVTVEKEEKRYRLTSETRFDASVTDLYRVLTDYSLFTEFSSVFVESRNLRAAENGKPRYYTRMEGCMLLFCKSFVRVGELTLTPHREIVALADPEESDFNYSRERWQLEADGDGAILKYEFELEPSFWVPPVIGPYVMKRVLRAGGSDAVDRIEALAQGKKPKR